MLTRARFYYRWYSKKARLASAWVRSATLRPGEVESILDIPDGCEMYGADNTRAHARLLSGARGAADGQFSVLYAGTAVASGKDFWSRHPLTGAPIPGGIQPYCIDGFADGDLFLAVWLGSFPFLPSLAQAYRATRNPDYLLAIDRTLSSWLDYNPPVSSLGWEDGLIIGLRAAAILYAFSILGPAASNIKCRRRIERLVVTSGFALEQAVDIPSFNHRLMSAFGLFCCGLACRRWRRHWTGKAIAILESEQKRQFFEDGMHAERSAGYMRFAVEIYLHTRILGEKHGIRFAPDFDQRLVKTCEALSVLCDCSGTLPAFGDDSDLDLFTAERKAAPALALAAVLFRRPDFKARAGEFPLVAHWLLGPAGLRQYKDLADVSPEVESGALPASGIYRMSSRSAQLLLTCGRELTPRNGHSHADVFSFELQVDGDRVLVDPGSYAYYPSRQWRDYFRSTPAHNTAAVDGQDQAVSLSDDHFGWAAYPRIQVHRWSTSDALDCFDGEHDGYERLPGGVRHRRRIVFVKPDYWLIVDDFTGEGVHLCESYFQFGPGEVTLEDAMRAVAPRSWGKLEIRQLEAGCDSDVVSGSEQPIRGWISAGYGHRRPAPSLRFAKKGQLPVRLCSLVVPLKSNERLELSRLPDGWQATCHRFADGIHLPQTFQLEDEIRVTHVAPICG